MAFMLGGVKMILSIIVFIVMAGILYNRGYTMEKLMPVALIAAAMAYFIPLGAILAWPFKLIGGALSFAAGALGAVGGGIGGLIGGIMGIIAGAISLVVGLVGGIVGLAFGMVGLLIGIGVVVLVPLAIIWIVFKMVL
jgi:hypothetical protein